MVDSDEEHPEKDINPLKAAEDSANKTTDEIDKGEKDAKKGENDLEGG